MKLRKNVWKIWNSILMNWKNNIRDLAEIWKAEKATLQGATHIKEALEQARIELETAKRAGDLARMSELQYGRIPELEKQLTHVSQQEAQETPKPGAIKSRKKK